MEADEKQIAELEKQFPPVSGKAFADAREAALNSGQSVIESEDGNLYEVHPDGSRKFLKKIDPPTPVDAGKTITIR